MNGFTYGADCTGAAMQAINIPNGQFYVGNYLNMLSGQKLPLFKAYLTQYPTIAQLLFNYDEIVDPTAGMTSPLQVLTYKSFPNTELVETLDGSRYMWSEWKYEEPEMYIVRDESIATNQFLIGDKS
jgi:hypothetical protein